MSRRVIVFSRERERVRVIVFSRERESETKGLLGLRVCRWTLTELGKLFKCTVDEWTIEYPLRIHEEFCATGGR
jgi:hypothetical protein